jgi:hypothetical protein
MIYYPCGAPCDNPRDVTPWQSSGFFQVIAAWSIHTNELFSKISPFAPLMSVSGKHKIEFFVSTCRYSWNLEA